MLLIVFVRRAPTNDLDWARGTWGNNFGLTNHDDATNLQLCGCYYQPVVVLVVHGTRIFFWSNHLKFIPAPSDFCLLSARICTKVPLILPVRRKFRDTPILLGYYHIHYSLQLQKKKETWCDKGDGMLKNASLNVQTVGAYSYLYIIMPWKSDERKEQIMENVMYAMGMLKASYVKSRCRIFFGGMGKKNTVLPP